MSKGLCIGIDVSKHRLDVATYPITESKDFANDTHGIAELLSWMRGLEPSLVMLEASGGYERVPASSLAAEQIPTRVINPRQVRDYARSRNILAKTDAIDAEIIAAFASVTEAEARPVPDQQAQQLKALVTRRGQLVDMITAEKNRLATAPKCVIESMKRNIECLQAELKRIVNDIDATIEANPEFQAKSKIMQTMPGIGKTTAAALLAELPELGTLGAKQIAALAGLAPYNCDSGKQKGERHIWGGRASVREAMYMGTMAATRYNPDIKEFYKRLSTPKDETNGCATNNSTKSKNNNKNNNKNNTKTSSKKDDNKPFRVKLIACMHKMLVLLNAMLRDNTQWRPAAQIA